MVVRPDNLLESYPADAGNYQLLIPGLLDCLKDDSQLSNSRENRFIREMPGKPG